MKSRATAADEQPRPKRPAALADAEIAHLETVVRYFVSSHAPDGYDYFDASYWLSRVVGIGQHFHLVPAQQRRLTALRTMLVGAAPPKPAACPHKCCACGR